MNILRRRPSRLNRQLAEHDRNEADVAAIAKPEGAAELHPDFSTADKALIAKAVTAAAGLSPRTLERGHALAAGMLARHGSGRDALAALLPHLRFAEYARDQSGPTASWAHAISVLRAAVCELHTPEPPPVSDEQADVLARAVLDGEEL